MSGDDQYYTNRTKRPLWEQLVATAINVGGSEASTEAQYKRALGWLQAEMANADTDTERAAVQAALAHVTAKYNHISNPPTRS